MNSVLKIALGRNINSVNCLLSNKGLNVVISSKCLLFDHKYLNLQPLWKEQEKLKAAILEKKEKIAFELEDVKAVTKKKSRILVAGSDSTFDLIRLINLAENLIKQVSLSPAEIRGFLLQIIRVAYVSDQIEYVLDMFKDQTFKPHVSGSFGGLIVMDKLYRNKRFDDIVRLFELQIDDYSLEKSFSESSPEYFRQTIPFDQLSCVVASLLQLNSKESFAKLKFVVDVLKKKNSTMNRRSVARAFLLSINQGEPEFALNLVHSNVFSIDLRLNLEIIALCLLDKPNQAFILADQMFMLRTNENYQHQGRFFPLVFKSFEQAIERLAGHYDYDERFNTIKKKAEKQNRISDVDLDKYCASGN